jgi:hypothetical protein
VRVVNHAENECKKEKDDRKKKKEQRKARTQLD